MCCSLLLVPSHRLASEAGHVDVSAGLLHPFLRTILVPLTFSQLVLIGFLEAVLCAVVLGSCIMFAVFTVDLFFTLLLLINVLNHSPPPSPLRCTTSRATCRTAVRWSCRLYLRTSVTASWNPWSSTSWTLLTPSCRGQRGRVHTMASPSPFNFHLVSVYLQRAGLNKTCAVTNINMCTAVLLNSCILMLN